MAKGGKTWYSFFLFSKDEQSSFGDLVLFFYLLSISFLSKPGEEPLWSKKKNYGSYKRGAGVPKKFFCLSGRKPRSQTG